VHNKIDSFLCMFGIKVSLSKSH